MLLWGGKFGQVQGHFPGGLWAGRVGIKVQGSWNLVGETYEERRMFSLASPYPGDLSWDINGGIITGTLMYIAICLAQLWISCCLGYLWSAKSSYP
jgi:hypothetical protein